MASYLNVLSFEYKAWQPPSSAITHLTTCKLHASLQAQTQLHIRVTDSDHFLP